MTEPIATGPALDLAPYLWPGDRVVWGQGCAEPQTLTETLVAAVTVRYERLLAVAHPEHRAALAAELEEHLMNGALR